MADRLQLKYERIQFYMAQGQIESDCHETVDSMVLSTLRARIHKAAR